MRTQMAKEINLTGEEVVAIASGYMSESDAAFVKFALNYATAAHYYQARKSGEPYIIHPIQVAGILADLHLDAVTVACGFCMMLWKIQILPWLILRQTLVKMCVISLTE